MAGPFDYRINVADPFTAATQGLQIGASIEQLRQQREDRARKLEQDKRLQDQQAAMQERVMSFIDRPTAQGALALSALMSPDQAKSIREGWDLLDKDTQRGRLEVAGQALTALKLGKSDIAIDLFRQYGEAARNSGDEETARAYDTYAELTGASPEGVMANLSGMIAPLPGGGELLENVFKEAKLPGEVREGEAKATKAGVDAKYADTRALLEIDEIKNDIQVKRLNSRIYAVNAALSREANDLKRKELGLKIEEMRKERDTRVREKASEAETAINGLEDTRAALADILSDEDTLRSAVGSSAWRGAIPGTKARTMAGKIEQLQNMMTESMLGKLKGAMSDSDLKFLRNIGTNMDRYQNEDAFIKELNRVSGVVERTLQNQRKKYGFSAPVQATPDVDIDAMVNKYLPGGM